MLSLLASSYSRWDSPSGERVAQSLRNYYFQFLPPTSCLPLKREKKKERETEKRKIKKKIEIPEQTVGIKDTC